MRVVSLGSGSSGNSVLVEAGPNRRTKLLVDAGLSARTLTERLGRVGVQPSQLQGVLVTHEHSDHVIGMPTLARRYGIPMIADPLTYAAFEQSLLSGTWRTDSGALAPLDSLLNLPQTDDALTTTENQVRLEIEHSETQLPFVAFPVGSRRTIGDIEVQSFPISHDATAPCGYLLQAGGCRVCVITDSGEVTPIMLEHLAQADLLILESNHDRERLLRGPYPQHLKQRILSSTGHLSNAQAADAILRTWRPDSVRWLWLAHLSRTNNTPKLALKSMREHLTEAQVNESQLHISASPPDMGPVWDSTQLWHTSSLWEMTR
ncbi:MAG TPA: MBL fold metallo-hydrolase [Ktedonobacter sp.]|nr:MBL fold metallo-hydrolase [Ktedonobacter sp.]